MCKNFAKSGSRLQLLEKAKILIDRWYICNRLKINKFSKQDQEFNFWHKNCKLSVLGDGLRTKLTTPRFPAVPGDAVD